MVVQKYVSMRMDGCTEIWKHEEGLKNGSVEARDRIAEH